MSKITARNGTVHIEGQLFLPAMDGTVYEIEQSDISVGVEQDEESNGTYKMVITAPVLVKKTIILTAKVK